MKNFILCLVVCCTFLLFSFESSAATSHVNYAEPTVGDNSGYLVIEYANGAHATFFWSAYCESEYINDAESMDTGCSIVVDENKVIFTILTDKNIDADITNSSTQYYFGYYTPNENMVIAKAGSTVDSNPTYTYTCNSNIVGFYAKGNVGIITNQLDVVNYPPVITFGADSLMYDTLNQIYTICAQNKNLWNTYIPMLNQLRFLDDNRNDILREMQTILESLQTNIETYYPTFNTQLQDINDTLWELKEYLMNEENAGDRQEIQDFDKNSSSQSNTLDSLNGQTQVEKPNIDDMSNKVDQNLDMNIDSNYAVLLSTFTTSNKILTMLLIAGSVSLISYVFFGKR